MKDITEDTHVIIDGRCVSTADIRTALLGLALALVKEQAEEPSA